MVNLERPSASWDGMNQARVRDNLDAWKAWGQKLAGLTPGQRDDLQDAYFRNSDRIAGTPFSFASVTSQNVA